MKQEVRLESWHLVSIPKVFSHLYHAVQGPGVLHHQASVVEKNCLANCSTSMFCIIYLFWFSPDLQHTLPSAKWCHVLCDVPSRKRCRSASDLSCRRNLETLNSVSSVFSQLPHTHLWVCASAGLQPCSAVVHHTRSRNCYRSGRSSQLELGSKYHRWLPVLCCQTHKSSRAMN